MNTLAVSNDTRIPVPLPANASISELLAKAKTGDNGAFSELYNLYFEKIYRFIFYRTSHKEVAEDLAEDVFVKAYEKLKSVKEDKLFEGWLYQIARNTIIDYYRSKKQNVPIEEVENILQYESTVIDILNLEAQQKIFLKLLKELNPEQQIVIKLKFLEELDNSSIAQMLHKSEGAIRVIQHRAISKLKELADKLKPKD